MFVKFILPALTEAKSIYWRSIKYSLFPPLGLATLAGYLSDDDEAVIIDEHVEELNFNDSPDIVAIQVYITSANRAYRIAERYKKKGIFVIMGGLHASTNSEECLRYADTVITGPAEEAWPRFLEDFRKNNPGKIYCSKTRSLDNLPPPRRDLIKKELYLVPNSIVVSRGCPHNCEFCYKESFYKGGKSYYTQKIEKILTEIESLKGKHLFFLDDHLLGNEKFALELFDSMAGMGRIWQAAGTVKAVMNENLLNSAVRSGLSSLFVGFESVNQKNLASQNKSHNIFAEYDKAIKTLHETGVMINGSFIFGFDEDDQSVFERTVEWAVSESIETATFHILTPYPGTRLYHKLKSTGRIITAELDKFDTRHAVFKPKKMSREELETGYKRAYKLFYSWENIFRSAGMKNNFPDKFKHLCYSSGWKKFEKLWEFVIRKQKIYNMIPLLEMLLSFKPSSSQRPIHHS